MNASRHLLNTYARRLLFNTPTHQSTSCQKPRNTRQHAAPAHRTLRSGPNVQECTMSSLVGAEKSRGLFSRCAFNCSLADLTLRTPTLNCRVVGWRFFRQVLQQCAVRQTRACFSASLPEHMAMCLRLIFVVQLIVRLKTCTRGWFLHHTSCRRHRSS